MKKKEKENNKQIPQVNQGLSYRCPMNLYYVQMDNLSTKEISALGYLPLSVTLRAHANSMYGKINGKTTTLWNDFDIPSHLLSPEAPPKSIKVYNKNSWGFDNITFKLPETKKSLEDLSNCITKELKKYVDCLKKEVEHIFNFKIPKKSEIQYFKIYVPTLVVKHIKTGKILVWKRASIESIVKDDGLMKALCLHSIDGVTMKTGLVEGNLWGVGEGLATPEDKFCIMGDEITTKTVNRCGQGYFY